MKGEKKMSCRVTTQVGVDCPCNEETSMGQGGMDMRFDDPLTTIKGERGQGFVPYEATFCLTLPIEADKTLGPAVRKKSLLRHF